MQQSDSGRFIVVLDWLCKRYGKHGVPLALPVGEDFNDYFDGLKDLPIKDIEQGARWHYAHSEFYPTLPAALRRSVEGWRAENPQRVVSSASVILFPVTSEREWLDPARFDEFLQEIDGWTMAEKFGESSRDQKGLRLVK